MHKLNAENLFRKEPLVANETDLTPEQKAWLDNYDRAVKAYIQNANTNELSKQTIKNYSVRLNFFRIFMVNEEKCRNIDPQVVFEFREWLMNKRRLSASSTRQYLREVTMFLDWCTWEEHPYFKGIELPKHVMPKVKKKPYMRLLSKEEIEKMVAFKETKQGVSTNGNYLRRRAMCLLMLMLGLRCGEVIGLEYRDINLTDGTLYVRHGKGDKQRLLRLPKAVYYTLQIYIEEGDHPDFHDEANANSPLFVKRRYGNGDWTALIPADVYDLVGVYTMETIGRKMNPHSLRHAAASFTYLNGASLEEVRQFLGHSDQTTTKIYLQKLFETVSAPGIENIWDRMAYDSEGAEKRVEEQIGVRVRRTNVIDKEFTFIAKSNDDEEYELNITAESEESARLKAIVYCNRNGLKLVEKDDGKARLTERKN